MPSDGGLPNVRFGSKADMCSALGDVRFVPKADIGHAWFWRAGHLQMLHLVAGTIILLLGLAMIGSLWLGYV